VANSGPDRIATRGTVVVIRVMAMVMVSRFIMTVRFNVGVAGVLMLMLAVVGLVVI
jgi:hypothetical protein